MQKQKGYLQAKYKIVVPGIEKAIQRGKAFGKCPSCEFEVHTSKEVGGGIGPIVNTVCQVCGGKSQQVKTPCPGCNAINIVDFWPDLRQWCGRCQHEIELEYVVNLQPPGSERAYCKNCPEFSDTIVEANGKWLCLLCCKVYDSVSPCEWCGSLVAGDVEDSYYLGCPAGCGGSMEHESGED